MSRISKTVTFSMPPEMAEEVRQAVAEEGRTMSEFLRDAVRLYMDERKWLRQERMRRRRSLPKQAESSNCLESQEE